MNCLRHSKKNRLKTDQTSKGKYPLGFPDSSNSIKMGPVQNNQIIKVYLLRGSTPVEIGPKNLPPFYSPANDMVQRTSGINAGFAWHAVLISFNAQTCNSYFLARPLYSE